MQKKLRDNGFNIEINEIISPLVVAPEVLQKESIKRLFVIGSENLKKFLRVRGFEVVDSPEVDGVLIGLDKEFNFHKMKVGTTALKVYSAKLYALNNNIVSKDDDGLLFPGVGTVARMFSQACQCNQDFKHFGKMGVEYNRVVFDRLGKKEGVAMISDDIYVDLKGYKTLGLKTIFVTTGKYKEEEAKDKDFIDIIVHNLMEIPDRVKIVDTEN
ncbi:MAG: HAD hydrolase-like protein [Persephonella sp.]|nr:HAD hydrolase-like protein [Persephonella sp.]